MGLIKQVTDVVTGKAPAGAKRSSKWPAVRRAILRKQPYCSVCSSTKKLEVHHIVSFHEDPSLELEPSNLIVLCENKRYGVVCHLFVGHLGSYRATNPDCQQDAENWRKKLTKARLGASSG